MALDFSLLKTPEMPSLLDSQQKAMALSQLGMQNAALARQAQAQDKALADQQAVRQAMAANTKDGKLDQGGFLSALGSIAPDARMTWEDHFNKSKKDAAEAQGASADAIQKTYTVTGPAFESLAKMPEDQRAMAYPKVIQSLKDQGANVSSMDHPYDPSSFQQYYNNWLNNKEHLAGMLTKSTTNKNIAETAETYAKTDKLKAETPKAMLGQIDPTVDPSTLVTKYVPKEHQPKVAEEIKAKQDLKALSPKIYEAFQMGTSRNPMVAAQGQRMFEGLINTTIKDAEGTVRQAAMDSVHNTMTPSGLTAAPGENDNRWKTVEAYLASKASAPLAKAHGLDLNKFDSTSPFTAPKKSSDDAGLIKTANAGETAGPPPGTIRMKAPNGLIKYVPLAQVGEAIAAGGEKVN